MTVFSKGRRNKFNTIPIVKPTTWDRHISILVSITRNKNKYVSVNKHITGSLSIRPLVLGAKINQCVFSSTLPQKFWLNNLPGNFTLLKFLSKYSIISNIFIKNFSKYALSNGTFCQILDLFKDFNLVKIVLPSKKIKLVSGWSFVILGRNSNPDSRFNRIGKAGIMYNIGKKPKVRGVARNPVDHPHGGRTKTNQPEVSVWGWIAKRNK